MDKVKVEKSMKKFKEGKALTGTDGMYEEY